LLGFEQVAVSINARQSRTANTRGVAPNIWNCEKSRFSKSPADLCSLRKVPGDRRDLKMVSNPGGLNAFRGRPKLQSFMGRSPGLKKYCYCRTPITVARPHGFLTRFPILPIFLGHPDAFKYKEQSYNRGTLSRAS